MIAAERAAKAFQLLDVASRYGKPSTLCRECPGDGTTEATRGTSDQRGHSRKVEHYAISFASASMSSIVTTLVTLTSGAIRLTIPASTLPPSSTNSSTPAAAILATLSRQ